MSEFAVWTQDLSRSFGAAHALDNVSFAVAHGQIAAIVGPNGSGKSTLMRLLLGLLRPTHGELRVLGLEPFAQAELLRRRVGSLLEQRKDPGNLSLLESLQSAGDASAQATLARPPAQSAEARASRIDDLLYRFDLWPYRHRRVVDLSRSERDKLAVVATLVAKPLLLILDEPFGTLDQDNRLHSLTILREIVRADQATLLFSTNALVDAETTADEILMLVQGRMAIQATPDDLLREHALPILEISGRGFTDEVISLLQRRPEVAGIYRRPNRLLIQFNRACETAPLISLLVESSADIDEVHKRRWDLEAQYRQLLHPPLQPESPTHEPSSSD